MGILTALVSLISGLVSGLAPEIMKEIRETRADKREREFLEAQHRWQLEAAKIQADAKIHESDSAVAVEELRAVKDQMLAMLELQSRPSGFRLVDAFNSVLRPAAVTGILVLFFWTSYHYADGVLDAFAAKKIDLDMVNAALWGSLLGDSFLAVMGFLFGYRSARKV